VNAVRIPARTYVAIAGLLAFAALFVSLGTWQLKRADESRSALARFTGAATDAPLTELPRSLDEAQRFRRVEAHGEFVTDPQFLLDNMLHDGVAGYDVLTALRVAGGRERVLVNRGWVRADADRRVLPNVAVAGEPRRVTGRLEHLPRPGLRLGTVAAGGGPAHGAVVLQYPTTVELAQLLGEPVLDYQLLLDPDEPDGYVREWRAPGLPPERHIGYAGQWFALAIGAAAAGVVIAFRTVRRES